MNNEDIIRMAQEAGGYLAELPNGDSWLFDDNQQLERFAALVADHEREACAKLADGFDNTDGFRVAAAIRERGNK